MGAGAGTGALRAALRAATAASAVLVLAACGGAGDSAAMGFDPGAPSAGPAVTAGHGGLLLDGRPWWPVGIDAPQFGTDYALNFGCGAEVDPDAFFAALPAHTLTRINVFQAFAVPKSGAEEGGAGGQGTAVQGKGARGVAVPAATSLRAGAAAAGGGSLGSLSPHGPDGAGPGGEPAPASGDDGEAVPASGLDFSALDAVFSAAAESDQLVLPVLAPGDGVCGDQRFKDRSWYDGGWREAHPVAGRSVMSYADWVRTAVQRWRSSPAVAGWEAVGEPDPLECPASGCVGGTPADEAGDAAVCPDDAADVMRGFFDDVGGLIHGLDPGRLVFAGTLGGGQCGTAGEDYRRVGGSDGIDVLDYHDYGGPSQALPGDEWDGLAVRIAQAGELGKPLIVGEIGVTAGACRLLLDRRDLVSAKIDGQRSAGTAGALLWAYVPDPRTGDCTYDIGPDDPLVALLGDAAADGESG